MRSKAFTAPTVKGYAASESTVELSILLVGLNHTTAPISVREQAFAVWTQDKARAKLEQHLHPALFTEHLVLTTCNRTEIYGVTSDAECGARALQAVFTQPDWKNLSRNPLYYCTDRAAVKHLFEVAAGLDSLVLGEFEILGQVRRAYESAQTHATVKATLHQLFQSALHVGKRARAETEVGSGALSVAHAALALARQTLGSLRGRTILVLGAGEMAHRVLENLRDETACTILLTNRTFEHAAELAHTGGGQAIPWNELPHALARADLVITAVQAPYPLLDAAMVARAKHPLCIIDLALPRNVAPEAASLPNIKLFNLDDFQAIVTHTRAQRTQAIAAVQAIIAAEADAFEAWQQTRRAAPLITELYARAETIRQAELEKTLRRLQHLPLTEYDRQLVAALTESIIHKLLAAPTAQLKAYAQDENAREYFDTVRELFDLQEP